MAKSGISKSEAKKAYKDVKGYLSELEGYINKLADDVEKMNKEYWYGGEPANKWYNNMVNHYGADKKSIKSFYSGVVNFQNQLQKVFQKAKTSGISFD